MMSAPPGLPALMRGSPLCASNASVGAMDERGRLPGCTRLATFIPFFSGAKVKSVISLLRK